MRLTNAFLLSVLLLQVVLPTQAGEHAVKPVHKVVFQVSDNEPQKWYLTLTNAKNVQQELGIKNVQIEVVVYGPGLDMVLLETEMAEKIDEARQPWCEDCRLREHHDRSQTHSCGYVPVR